MDNKDKKWRINYMRKKQLDTYLQKINKTNAEKFIKNYNKLL